MSEGHLEALEQKGLVERTPHPNHRRVFPAALTQRGRKVLEAGDAAVDELEREMLKKQTPSQAHNNVLLLVEIKRKTADEYTTCG